jgi:hypothetical protein
VKSVLWRQADEFGVFYTEDREHLRRLLALDWFPMKREEEAATYKNPRGRVFAWQATFDASLWRRVVRALGREEIEIRLEEETRVRKRQAAASAAPPLSPTAPLPRVAGPRPTSPVTPAKRSVADGTPAALSPAAATRTAGRKATQNTGSNALPAGKATAPHGVAPPASEAISPTPRTPPRPDGGKRPSAPGMPAPRPASPPDRLPEPRPRKRPAKSAPEPSMPLAVGPNGTAPETTRLLKQPDAGKPLTAQPEQKQRRTKPSAPAAMDALRPALPSQQARTGARTKPFTPGSERAGLQTPGVESKHSRPRIGAAPSGKGSAASRSSVSPGTPPARPTPRSLSGPLLPAPVPVLTPTVAKRTTSQRDAPTAKTAIGPPGGAERKRTGKSEAQQTLALDVDPAATPTRRSKSSAAPATNPTAPPAAVGAPDQPSKPASRRRAAPIQQPVPKISRARG